MAFFRSLIAGMGFTLMATAVQAQTTSATSGPAPERKYPLTSIGLTLGWGAPYGWGVDLSYMVTPHLDVNAGVGLSITGAKIGVGTRYYLAPEHKVSPFAGANFAYSTGINNIKVDDGPNYNGYTQNQVTINYQSASLLHLRGGIRWQPTYRFGMIGALGYGIVVSGGKVEYPDGSYPQDQSTRDALNLLAPGGIELSVGVAFGLGSRD